MLPLEKKIYFLFLKKVVLFTWIKSSVSRSTAAVASSRTKIFVFPLKKCKNEIYEKERNKMIFDSISEKTKYAVFHIFDYYFFAQ